MLTVPLEWMCGLSKIARGSHLYTRQTCIRVCWRKRPHRKTIGKLLRYFQTKTNSHLTRDMQHQTMEQALTAEKYDVK